MRRRKHGTRSAQLFVQLSLAFLLARGGVEAQVRVDVPPPGDTLYEVQLGDGSVVFARVTATVGERVTLMTDGGGRLEVDRPQIREIRAATGQIVNGEYWKEDPGSTRLFFTATGRSLNAGEAYVGTYVVVLPFIAVGITDRLTLAAGAPVLFGEFQPFYLAPKFQIVRTPRVQAALGTIAFFYDEDVVGIAYGVGTVGDSDDALSVGVGWGYSGADFESEPVAMVGGEARVSPRVKLLTENYLLPGAVLLSGGLRIIGDRFSTEVGIVGGGGGGGAGCCLPLLNVSYAFGP